MNRKNEHIQLAAKGSKNMLNDFDRVRFIHHCLSDLSIDDIDLSLSIDGIAMDAPFFINAMTGGSEWTKSINEKLARVASYTGLAMATGSMSAAIKESSLMDTFTVIREINPKGIVFTNLQASATLDAVNQTIDWVNPDAIQLHVNITQELLMPEGDRYFNGWLKNIEHIVSNTKIPVIIKEVGFGFSQQMLNSLQSVGVKNVDISGKGGTNFAEIENQRSETAMDYMNNWGQSTVCSLLESQAFVESMNIIASGGIRHALDIAKSLALGAKAVGISGFILRTLLEFGEKETIKMIEQIKEDLIKIMVLLNVQRVDQFKQTDLLFDDYLLSYAKQRNINISHLSLRRK